MRCEAVLKRLDSFRTGELEDTEKKSVAAHLSNCRECARELAQIERLAAGFTQLRSIAPEGILEHLRHYTGDCYAEVETDIGKVWVGFSSKGITMIGLAENDPEAFEASYRRRIGRRAQRGNVLKSYARAVRQAAAGAAAAAVAIDLSGLSEFERKALMILRQIPRGEVRPYAWLAREVGRPEAARAVGNVMARNPVPLLLPCHRVVPTAGGIGNYGFGSSIKRDLLSREGVPVDEIERLAGEGVRYIGCRSSNIYCFPTCHYARRICVENRVPLSGFREAARAGFRPCRHCKPDAAPI